MQVLEGKVDYQPPFELNEKHILYLDNHLMVVNKPAGLLVQPDKQGSLNLEEAARQWLKLKFNKPGNVFATACHRLDRPVSGLVILARTSKALARMNAQFQSREVKKLYLSVVYGKPEQQQQFLRHWIKKNETPNTVRVYTYPRGDARQADLCYRMAQQSGEKSMLIVRLFTGRHHQIRAQLGFSGLPIAGDAKYGRRNEVDESVCLCSWGISFRHPVSGKPIELFGDIPQTGSWSGFFLPDSTQVADMLSILPPS